MADALKKAVLATGKLSSEMKLPRFGVYDVKVALVVGFILASVLWWVPFIGPAAAGYACGRKTGSMVKGMVCSAIAGSIMVGIVWGLSQIILPEGGFPDVAADAAAASMTGFSGMAASYLQLFFSDGTSSLDLSALGVFVLFGFFGGFLSRQHRMEVADLLDKGATEGAYRKPARSIDLYMSGKTIGFECFDDCMASQNVLVNDVPESKRSPTPQNPAKEPLASMKKPVTTTVHTVTTLTSSETAAVEQDTEPRGGNPFADILGRNERGQPPRV